jgi:hypothetical protein
MTLFAQIMIRQNVEPVIMLSQLLRLEVGELGDAASSQSSFTSLGGQRSASPAGLSRRGDET